MFIFCVKEADWGMMALVTCFAPGISVYVPRRVPCTVYHVSNTLVEATKGVGSVNFWSFTVARTRGGGRPMDRGAWTTKTVKRPRQQPAHPQYAHYWAPLTRKRHTPPHSAQPQHTNYWAPRTRKRHQQEHRPQRLTERSDPTQHAKGRAGDCPGPRKETATRRNVTQRGGHGGCC